MNALSEHRKYIFAMIAGACVSLLLGASVLWFFEKQKQYKESKEKILMFSHEIMHEKLDNYIIDLDKCNHRIKQLNEVIEKDNENYVKHINQLKKQNRHLYKVIDSLIVDNLYKYE
jgi:flagellar motility protein MotE (MotC chaperone)